MIAERAAAIAAAARDLAPNLGAGGTLYAWAGSRTEHARHIAVEFLHPVVAGKPALPAIALEPTVDAWVPEFTPDDSLILIEDTTLSPEFAVLRTAADKTDALTIEIGAFADPSADHALVVGSNRTGWDAEVTRCHHILWESVHALLEHGPESPAIHDEIRASAQAKLTNSYELAAATLSARASAIADSARLLTGRRILTFGNGGSAADAIAVARLLGGHALCDDAAVVTALANDCGFENTFARQLAALARPGDVLIALSTSGASENVVIACETGRDLGLESIAICGYSGGLLGVSDAVDLCITIDSDSVHRIQETTHELAAAICLELTGGGGGAAGGGDGCVS